MKPVKFSVKWFKWITIYKPYFLVLFSNLIISFTNAQSQLVWEIGKPDNRSLDFALAPSDYKKFLEKDFGWEDRVFIIGHSIPQQDWPYVLPGPANGWAGTGPTSGIRSHILNILLSLDKKPVTGNWKLIIDILDTDSLNPPLFKVNVNGKSWKYKLPKGTGELSLQGNFKNAKGYLIEIPLDNGLLIEGGNEIQLTTLEGSWLIFDQIKLMGPENVKVTKPEKAALRAVKAASYEIEKNGKRFQPLLIDIEHLKAIPNLRVLLDGKLIFEEQLEKGRYLFEAPMEASTSNVESKYQILVDNKILSAGKVNRSKQNLITQADYVDTRIGSAHSRWMIAPGPWMPFSMVKLSPDNQNEGWQAGYDPTFESIGTFSHIHEWTMAALGVFPTNGKLKTQVGDESGNEEGYRSKINKSTEEAPLGYYKVFLEDYGIQAELTATTRCGFQRYTYPKGTDSRILIDLQIPSEYRYNLEQIELKKVGDRRIEGFSKQISPNAWSGGVNQEYTVNFIIEFDQPIIKCGTWLDGKVASESSLSAKDAKDAGIFVEFDTRNNQVVQVRSALSLVSVENAANNLLEEITKPFGWNFDSVRNHQVQTWNDLLGRIQITSNDRREKIRFYTNMYRALCSRNTWSDFDGKWIDATEKIQQLKNPENVMLGCDAFWNTFWNLNQFWNLITPEWSSRWVNSQLEMYKSNGWLAKGPAGLEYIPVMVAEHEIPLIVGAYQMGIRDYNIDTAFNAAVKMQTTLPKKVGNGFAGNNDLESYLKYKYVPYDKGRFSNSLEYSYDDWTVAQFAKALGKNEQYDQFKDRATWWRNAIDDKIGYARMRDSKGNWQPQFDPFKSGANEHYVEGNAWQLTFFVPQDVPALSKIIGVDKFIERLNWGFTESNKLRYNAPNDQYWDFPVIQGNQQSMHFAFLFNWVKQPWLTQKWSRSILDRYYGYGVDNAYLGDEDQGQMSAWFIMAALGLFQTDGGCRVDPIYEIGSPLFQRVTINLGKLYGRGQTFTIEAKNASRLNKYVQSATLNGKELSACWFPASELLKGGKLELQMGSTPNTNWGLESPLAAD